MWCIWYLYIRCQVVAGLHAVLLGNGGGTVDIFRNCQAPRRTTRRAVGAPFGKLGAVFIGGGDGHGGRYLVVLGGLVGGVGWGKGIETRARGWRGGRTHDDRRYCCTSCLPLSSDR